MTEILLWFGAFAVFCSMLFFTAHVWHIFTLIIKYMISLWKSGNPNSARMVKMRIFVNWKMFWLFLLIYLVKWLGHAITLFGYCITTLSITHIRRDIIITWTPNLMDQNVWFDQTFHFDQTKSVVHTAKTRRKLERGAGVTFNFPSCTHGIVRYVKTRVKDRHILQLSLLLLNA